MNYELYRLLNKKKKKSSAASKILSAKPFVKPPTASDKSLDQSFLSSKIFEEKEQRFNIPCLKSTKNSFEFAIPRTPSQKKEFSFENSKDSIIIPDNFSFSETITKSLKRVKESEDKCRAAVNLHCSSNKDGDSSPGVLGSICNSIMSRYNSFIKVHFSAIVCNL